MAWNGSNALHLSILAAGIGPGDEVITTPMTFCATVNAIIHAGATPVLADVNPNTMNIDPTPIFAARLPSLEDNIWPRPGHWNLRVSLAPWSQGSSLGKRSQAAARRTGLWARRG